MTLTQTARGRIERSAGQQQCFAHRTGFGHRSGGSHDRDLQRNGGGQHRQQSERGRHRHPRQRFANGHHPVCWRRCWFRPPACAPASLGQSAVSTCTVTLTQTRSRGRIERNAGQHQRCAHRTGFGHAVAVGATTASFSATAAASIDSNQSAAVTATLGSGSQTATIGLLAPVLVSTLAYAPAGLGPERGEHLYGDADADGSGRRIERNAGQ